MSTTHTLKLDKDGKLLSVKSGFSIVWWREKWLLINFSPIYISQKREYFIYLPFCILMWKKKVSGEIYVWDKYVYRNEMWKWKFCNDNIDNFKKSSVMIDIRWFIFWDSPAAVIISGSPSEADRNRLIPRKASPDQGLVMWSHGRFCSKPNKIWSNSQLYLCLSKKNLARL